MLPTPASRFWSMMAFLTAVRVPLSRSANTNGVNVSSSGSGPSRPVYAIQPFSSSSQIVPSRRTSRYTNLRPSVSVQIRTAYFASSRVSRRSSTRSEPVMRGWLIRRWPDESRNTACLARRETCSMVLPRSVLIRRALETWRNTSVFFSSTRAMRDPSRRGAISRTIVSTSGSSGTLDLAPGDVAPPGLALKGDALGCATARLRGECHGRTESGHTQHTATGGPQSSFVIAIRARVKDDHIVAEVQRVREPDRGAFFRIVGIPARGQDGGDRGPIDDQRLLARHGVPAPLRNRRKMLAESGQQRGQEYLRFRVAETRIEFEHRGCAIGPDHQTGIQHTFVGSALSRDFA